MIYAMIHILNFSLTGFTIFALVIVAKFVIKAIRFKWKIRIYLKKNAYIIQKKKKNHIFFN